MPELRAASTPGPRGAAPQRWRQGLPLAPWRGLLLAACLVLAAAAAHFSWSGQRTEEARAADPEVMLRVALRWADARALATPAADDTSSIRPTRENLAAWRADTARVLALMERQAQLEPAAPLEAAREAWAGAQQRLTSLALDGTPSPESARRLRDDAAAAALAAQRLMEALRQRAEARDRPAADGARPGVLLALASLGLLALGLRRAHVAQPEAESLQAAVPAELAPVAASDGSARLIDATALQQRLATAWDLAARQQLPAPLLLVLQLECRADLLAEIGDGARLDLERQAVHRLREQLHGGDLIALGEPHAERLELIVLAAASQPPAALQSLFDDIADAYTVLDHPVQPPLRLGVVDTATGHGQPAGALRDARLACAAATPGSIVFFTPELGQRDAQRQGVAEQIDAALRGGELGVVYRAVLGLHDRKLLGWRAELRWHRPALGLLAGGELMRLAAEADRAALLLQQLHGQALRHFVRWRSLAPAGARIGVPMPITATTLAEVQQLLASSELEPAALELLIAEPGAADADSAMATLCALRELGVRVTLHSLSQDSASLSWLPRLALGAVVIDQRFVEQLPGHDAHAMLIQAIVSLAAQQGLHTSADGCDSALQQQALAALGVASAQGDWAAATLDAAGVDAWLSGRPH